MTPVRIGFVGAGFIANVHAGILAADGRVRVAAVFDPDNHAADLFALKYGTSVAPSLDELLSAVDAVYVCSPNAHHASTAVRALDAGVHTFCEKPMATSPEDAGRVLEAAKRSRGIYQAGFNRRFAPVYVALKQRIDSGALTPTSALLKMNRGELQHPAWTGDLSVSGGFLYETPIHILDLARHVLGEPVEVVCRARSTVYDQPDDFSILLTFQSGMSAVVATSAHTTWLYPFERVEMYGDHAMAATEEMDRITFATGVGAPAETLEYSGLPIEDRWGYREEDRFFVDALSGIGEPVVSAEEAATTVALVDRCYQEAGLAR